MTLDRRQMMIGGLGVGTGLAAVAGPRVSPAQAAAAAGIAKSVIDHGVEPGVDRDQTATLQKTIDDAVKAGVVLHFPAGEYQVSALSLPSGTNLSGVPGRSILKITGPDAGLRAHSAENIRLSSLVLDGGGKKHGGAGNESGLFFCDAVKGLTVRDCKITGSGANGVSLTGCSGQITDNEIANARRIGLFCIDSAGLEISHNHVHDCGDNGIQVWRSSPSEDGTIIAHNRVEAIRAVSGGTGQNGNGINVFRAGSVQVTGNRITDCVFSAIRGNATSNFQVTGNSCARLGEVAIYAEFGFEGTIIANNLVDKAATGISITNFNEGGRMAVVQGNLVRNLFLRKGEDKRGVGIAVEADAMVSGNLVEGAPGGGIMVGWAKYLRDVNVTGNLVREARIGIGISALPDAGYAYVTNNMLSVTAEGGIRAMDHDKLLGPDLAKTSSEAYRNMAVFGNVSL